MKDTMTFEEFMAMQADWQPLDPSGESDRLHDLKKQGLTTPDERLAAYYEVQRIY